MRRMTHVEIPPNAGDFRLLDRKIVDVINEMPERYRFMKGIFAWPGFKTESVEFQANVRAGGRSRVVACSSCGGSRSTACSRSRRCRSRSGRTSAACRRSARSSTSLITLIQKMFFGIDVPGYASLLIVMLFFNGLLLLSNGIQGEYIARIFEEVKGRPLFVVGRKWGFDEPAVRAPGAAAVAPPAPTAAPTIAPSAAPAIAPAAAATAPAAATATAAAPPPLPPRRDVAS